MRASMAGLLVSLLALPAFAQNGEDAAAIDDFDREPVDCIRASSIQSTAVVDERTILFYMRGGDIYRNPLSVDCRGLVRERSFSYNLATSRLCEVDYITVVERWGSSIREGISCGLGQFFPITEEEAIFLRSSPDEQLEAAQSVTAPKDDESDERSETPVDPPAEQ